jgi:hypothetical protein
MRPTVSAFRNKRGATLLALLLGLPAGCSTNTTPDVREVTSFGLGPDAFGNLPATDAGVDAPDVREVIEVSDTEETSARLGGPCSILEGNCQENLKCGVDYRGRGICVEAGDRQAGETCGSRGVDDCDVGLLCYDIDGTGLACIAVCNVVTGAGCDGPCGPPLRWTTEPLGLCP